MFANQRKFVPKSQALPKPKVKIVEVAKPADKPRTPVNGSRVKPSSSSSARPSPAASGGVKRSVNRRPRSSNSSATPDYLVPPSDTRKRIRSPTTDSERVAFDDSDGDSVDDNDWESRLKRRKHSVRADPDRKLRHSALTELEKNGYKEGRTVKIIHAEDIVSLALGDEPCFPDAKPEDLRIELQYPGSLTRERFDLAKKKDKLDVINDIIRVVTIVKDTYITDDEIKAEFNGEKGIIRQLWRQSNSSILNLAGFKEAIEKYNRIVRKLLKSGDMAARIDDLHVLPNDLVYHILTQVYDRVVTPKVDSLKRYENGSDNVYGEMNKNFITQVLSTNLKMTSRQVFVDLGSGVGNVALQAALQIGCESWGCEMLQAPAELGKAQHREFRARCKLWGIQPGEVHLFNGDFTMHDKIREVLPRADVVLANNQAFTPDLNETLKIMFLDLKAGCKIVSLKKFTSGSKYNVNDIANTILEEPEQHKWPEKGVSWTDTWGHYHITAKK